MFPGFFLTQINQDSCIFIYLYDSNRTILKKTQKTKLKISITNVQTVTMI